jgi:hypothetical protein
MPHLQGKTVNNRRSTDKCKGYRNLHISANASKLPVQMELITPKEKEGIKKKKRKILNEQIGGS